LPAFSKVVQDTPTTHSCLALLLSLLEVSWLYPAAASSLDDTLSL